MGFIIHVYILYLVDLQLKFISMKISFNIKMFLSRILMRIPSASYYNNKMENVQIKHALLWVTVLAKRGTLSKFSQFFRSDYNKNKNYLNRTFS